MDYATATTCHSVHRSWQCIAIDYITNKPTSHEGYSNILTIIDEYSDILFAFPTCDQSSSTVIKHLSLLFTLAFLLQFILIRAQNFFQQTSHPFSQVGVSTRVALHHIFLLVMAKQNILMASFGRLQCLMKDCHLPGSSWPSVLSEALYCICSLISTAMDTSPHNLFLF